MAIKLVPSTPSSNIAFVQYDDETLELTIWFQKGGVYVYYQVPEDVALGFSGAPSATKYMETYIVNSYPSNRVG